ncbi:uncharacterized protein LOC108094540 [Drosophila ficusphila]|uniref:uncharacterized protein LOC108094540 n=1 Tax=Drosophila ficusphila TaxID=30025 RepID=UPI0007E6247B|nr:uncharacterized protein LOC108094540 [Drosophila ficusphila]
MESQIYVFLLLIACLIVGSCLAAPQECGGGFTTNGNDIVINVNGLSSYLACIRRQG